MSNPVHKTYDAKAKMKNSEVFLRRWWKVAKPHTGLVVRSLAPNHQRVIGPLFENLPAKIMHRIKPNFWYVAPPFVGAYLLTLWADNANDQLHRSHWS